MHKNVAQGFRQRLSIVFFHTRSRNFSSHDLRTCTTVIARLLLYVFLAEQLSDWKAMSYVLVRRSKILLFIISLYVVRK